MQPQAVRIHRSLLLAAFLLGAVWLVVGLRVAASAAQMLADRWNQPALEALLEQVILFAIVMVQLRLLDWLLFRKSVDAQPGLLIRRATAAAEAQRGVAIGWGSALVVVLPLVLLRVLHSQFVWNAASVPGLVLCALTTALGCLTMVLVFQGYFLRWLRVAYGPTTAAVLVSLLYAVLWSSRLDSSAISTAAAFLFALLLCLAYSRTHGLWLAWGLRFGWTAGFAVLLGMRVSGVAVFNGLVTTETDGSRWLTGGLYGPDGSLLALVVLAAATFVVYRATREYEWAYTHAPLVGKAYAVVVAPPAAHTAMEQAAAAAPTPLVQILPTTSARPSVVAEIEQHLRSDANPADPR